MLRYRCGDDGLLPVGVSLARQWIGSHKAGLKSPEGDYVQRGTAASLHPPKGNNVIRACFTLAPPKGDVPLVSPQRDDPNYGIDGRPFRGSNFFWLPNTQGVALGYIRNVSLARVHLRPKGAALT
jgi:hypothetical protein